MLRGGAGGPARKVFNGSCAVDSREPLTGSPPPPRRCLRVPKAVTPMSEIYSAEFFEQFLELDSSSPSGLRWRVDSPGKNSNRGKPAGCMDGSKGYYRVEILGKIHRCHRLVLIMNGVYPQQESDEVDHIDRDRSNNALNNLRWCSRSQNGKNKRVLGRVTYRYVYRRGEKYAAVYKYPNTRKSIHVGVFKSPREAHLAALAHRLENHWISS